jgi:hypothetical protein
MERPQVSHGVADAHSNFPLLRERWPLAFPAKPHDVLPLALGAADEIAAAHGMFGALYVRRARPLEDDGLFKRLASTRLRRWRNFGHDSMYRGLERRLAPRRLGPKPALILFGQDAQDALFECTIRDFSPAGAGLVMHDAVTLPSAFDLRFDHVTRHCIAVWRQRDRVGLKFSLKD